jgi:Signal transduction histidine kinase regulating citrate/malate metabolism
MEMLIILSIIFIQILVYSAGIVVLFGGRVKNVKLGIFILFLCSGGYYFFKLSMGNLLYLDIMAIIILWAIIQGTVYQKSWLIIKGVFIVSCSEEIAELALDFLLTKCFNLSIVTETNILLANLLLLILWFAIGILKKRNFKIHRKYVNAIYIIAMGIMAVALVLGNANIRYAQPYVNSKKFSMVSEILMIITYIGIVFWGLFVIFIKNANENYKHLLETEYLLRTSQKNNYEMMLAKEEETREFRHDISNHIICLKELVKSGNMVDANNYIDQMQIKISEIKKKYYTTGNEILDAILNFYINLLDDKIEVSITGRCNYELAVNSVELCSIISNPLQNAVEALNNLSIQEKGYLKVQIQSTQQNFKIVISNSLDTANVVIRNGLPITNKKDKENHGIGLKNVKKLVEKNQGLFNVEILDAEFRVTLILPVKN